jgi:16S rRNA (uracil1498-N3)-methyltransferase
MQRYFAIDKKEDLLILNADDHHHIFNVMRLTKTDKIEVVYDGFLYCCNAEIIDSVGFQYISSRKLVDNSYNLTFLLATSKSDKLELVIQKVTEICAASYIVYNSKRSVSIWTKDKFENKKNRFSKIIKEACEQSKQHTIPTINFVNNLNEICFQNYDLKLIAYEKENEKNLIKNSLLKNAKNILVVIGPEGGFDEKEVDDFINKGFISVSLGNSILRCETAPIYTASIISYFKELNDE